MQLLKSNVRLYITFESILILRRLLFNNFFWYNRFFSSITEQEGKLICGVAHLVQEIRLPFMANPFSQFVMWRVIIYLRPQWIEILLPEIRQELWARFLKGLPKTPCA
ncbi:unnamed protein product [Natator depressus]